MPTPPPILHTVPPEVRTPRLLLRRPQPADAEALCAAIQASLPELQPWMFWAQTPPDLIATRDRLEDVAAEFDARRELRYHVWRVPEQAGVPLELIGSSGYHALDWRVPKGEIGYWIATAHAGQGYATEVTHALTELALHPAAEGGLGFCRLEIRCDPTNHRSARIPPTLGYTLDAHLVNDTVAANDPGQLRDTLIFSRTS
ncbi:GNAT family N-acetyltransferase [Deinococcus sp. Arct2-2]|uniref:GNAT family N-acetyltransferase n=1 Tax=Deinococcus sp. Arct2-2 TaxID=2568653 RepID=UPI0010A3AA28|nr:GNAT family N-acetyltransferase [Deinococcus sp. Arct2-2]THF68772.1 GNAT family N-acetyltransferase [Deinococcus sp. Arct2-2]